jgi:UDP-N-acetylglucosamine 1-carboxyvinyltransferase
MNPSQVLVRGATSLKGKVLESPDLRAGIAFVIAAAIAKGQSVIGNIYNIDRGYENLEARLQGIGLRIRREMR